MQNVPMEAYPRAEHRRIFYHRLGCPGEGRGRLMLHPCNPLSVHQTVLNNGTNKLMSMAKKMTYLHLLELISTPTLWFDVTS